MMRFGDGEGVMGEYILKCLLSLWWNFCWICVVANYLVIYNINFILVKYIYY
jgi:hypothetical protein